MKRLLFCLMLVTATSVAPHVAAAQSLYGLFYQDGMEYFVRLDPETGTVSTVDSLPSVRSVQYGASAVVDAEGERFFFLGGDRADVRRLYAVDVTSGDVISKPAVTLGEHRTNLGELEYSPADDRLYGLSFEQSENDTIPLFDGTQYFVSVDTLTGGVTDVGVVPGVTSIATTSSTFNPDDNEYMFWGGSPKLSHLYTLDAADASVQQRTELTVPDDRNLAELQYDPSTDRLLGLSFARNVNDTIPPVDGTQFFVSVGPGDALKDLDVVPGARTVDVGSSVLAPEAHRYYYTGDGRLRVLNTQTGQFVASHPLGTLAVTDRQSVQWDALAYGASASTAAEEPPNRSLRVALRQNAPNPFSDATTIRYDLPQSEHVTLTVYDALGRLVATLADGRRATGTHRVRFEARPLPAGVYVARLRAGARTVTQTLTVVK